MKRNLLASTIAVALASTFLFSACNPTPAQQPQASVAKTEAAPASKAPETKAPEVKAPEVNLTVEVFDRADYPSPSTADNNPLSRWVVEKVKKDINVNVKYVPVPRSQEYDKLNVMMAGNSAPDIVFTYNIAGPSLFAKQGGLTDLAPYIDKVGPKIKTELAEQLPYGVFSGKQHAIPAKRVDDDVKHATFIREDILKKYGLTMPKTKEEFYIALKTVKEKEPTLIPYAMATTKNERYYENFVMSYAKYATDKEFYQYAIDACRMASPGVKDGFKELNKWYNEGLISTDFALDAEAKQLRSDISNGKAFSFTDDVNRPLDDKLFQTASTTVQGLSYMPLNTFQNHQGKFFFNRYEPIGLYMMVPKANEKNAEAAVKYINWMFEGENMATLKNGVEIGCASFDPAGLIISKNPDELAKLGMKDNMFSDIGIVQSKYTYKDPSNYKKARVSVYSIPGFDPTATIDRIYEVRKVDGLYTIPRLNTPVDAEAKFGTSIRDSIKSMSARLIACKPAEFDALWDQEYKSLETAGLTSIIEERGKVYDAQFKK